MARRAGQRSLARDLLVFLLAAIAAAWVATALVSYFEARHELQELLDAHLMQVASLLLAEASQESRTVDAEHAPQLHRYGRRVSFQLWEDGTRLRLHSANAPDTRLSRRDEGFSDVVHEGDQWRVFSAWDEKRHYVVQVGERADARDEIVAKIATNLLVPLLFALPALALLIGLGIRRATQPLRALSRQVEQRTPVNLAPVEVTKAPTEVAPLVDSLNRLFERVRLTSENERRFTADAAHELRTPLAALRAQAQVARGSTDDAERRRALENVIAGCDRAAHLVAQLLTLARLEPQGFRAERAPCDLRTVLTRTIAEFAPMALDKSMELELRADSSPTVLGEANLLEILFRNLIDNAVRYGPAHSRVSINIEKHQRTVVVRIADEGPGVPSAERGNLGRRFHRLGGSDASGSGLGLSIAVRIAELHEATIAFAEPQSTAGLVVTVSFATGA